jgi:hypothetical protein
MDTITAARQYVQHGLAVFPVKFHDKFPLFPAAHKDGTVCHGGCGRLGHGLWDATLEENLAVGWFETNTSANIGIACGKKSGIVVLDIDPAHGGNESIEEIYNQHGKLPTTPVAKTGGGGEHIFFAYPEGLDIRNSAGRLGPGLDIRAEGGYVVASPSIHPNGKCYEWVIGLDTPLAPMPQWMIESLKDSPPQATPVSSGGVVANGSRNMHLTSLAGTMRNKGFSEDAMYAALLIHNREKCNPPLSDGEVLVIARSVSRYTPKNEPKTEEHKVTDLFSIIDDIETKAQVREAMPSRVWGIPYAWDKISDVTGGKQPDELIYAAGDSGIGKSWWSHQDAAYTAIYKNIPVLIWSGEMGQKQIVRRVMYMLGVDRDALLTGFGMSAYWQRFNEAKAMIVTSPLHICDEPLSVSTVEKLLERECGDHGIQQALFDYDRLITAPGDGDTEKSQNISRCFKQAANKFNISIMIISSMNKLGMDVSGTQVLKSHMSGSGQKVYDSDNIFIFTPVTKDADMPDYAVPMFKPADYYKLMTLSFAKGRELDPKFTSKKLLYVRETPRPSFAEVVKPETMSRDFTV